MATTPAIAQTASLPFESNDPTELRRAIRTGAYTGYTNGLAPGYVQVAPVVIPRRYAEDFTLFCQRNPQPMPLLGVSEPGSPHLPDVGADLDIRSDVGVYQIYRDGVVVEQVTDIGHLWQDDFVTFVIGCSFSFEFALMEAGIPLRHIDEGSVSPMYRTSIETRPAGIFSSELAVSMRFFKPADAIRAIQISSRYPAFHGAPVHIAHPELIGIDPANSYGGHGLKVGRPDEIPVFWACGAVAQFALERAKLPIAITHHKAHMLVTDLRIRDYALI